MCHAPESNFLADTEYPATGMNQLASFVRIKTGEAFTTKATATSQVFYCIRWVHAMPCGTGMVADYNIRIVIHKSALRTKLNLVHMRSATSTHPSMVLSIIQSQQGAYNNSHYEFLCCAQQQVGCSYGHKDRHVCNAYKGLTGRLEAKQRWLL